VLTIRCANQSARLMASKMLGMPPEEVDNDSWDALGEVANMIAGNFKGKLSAIGNHCLLSVPTIIVGSDYKTRSLGPGKTLQAVFDFDHKPLWVTLELHD
jgi:chemotaxis protein CheX